MSGSPNRLVRPFTASLAVFALAVVFLPELMGFGWHLLHGNAASYRGWTIPVPAGWFAIHHGESLTLERILRFPSRQSAPVVVFLPMHTATDSPFDPNVWEDVQVRIQNQRGYRLAATRQLAMAGEPAYCWEFVRIQDDSNWWITCLMPSGRLSADFSGQPSFADTFFAILPRIARGSDPI